MTIFLLIVIFCLWILFMEKVPSQGRASHGVMVSRSSPSILRPDTLFCGNCHGTGDEGFGMMPDSAGACDACDGRGYVTIDPNAKYVSLGEIFKSIKTK